MNIQIIAIAWATLFLSACIAGPTPHPGHDPGADPNVSNVMDTYTSSPGDNVEESDGFPPSTDVLESSDALSEDAQSDDAQSDDADDQDSVTEEDGFFEDSSPNDTPPSGDAN